MEEKYVVFKKGDWDQFRVEVCERLIDTTRGEEPTVPDNVMPRPITDCFVIRFQDVLAGPGLHAYAGAAQAIMDAIYFVSASGMKLPFDPAGIERARDAAFEAATIADEYPNKKVPD